jgi:hypothetical protein
MIHDATPLFERKNKMNVYEEPYGHQTESGAPQPAHSFLPNRDAMTGYPMNVNVDGGQAR